MHNQTHYLIRQVMSLYISKEKKTAYKRKKMIRLISTLKEIMNKDGDPRLSAIGRRQIIRYRKGIEGENDKTRREKYSILRKSFVLYNPKVTVPEPTLKN